MFFWRNENKGREEKGKENFKRGQTFFTFYITSTIFYYYLNKKNPLQYNFFFFFFLLFHINSFNFILHQSRFTIIQKKKKFPQHERTKLPNEPSHLGIDRQYIRD
jgi:hypothetical protein